MDNLNLFLLLFGTRSNHVFLNNLMIFVAEYSIYLAFVFMFILAIKGSLKEKKAFIVASISIVVTILIIKLIHIFFFEPRPFITYDITPLISSREDASFPSRHTAIVSSIAFAYIFYRSKWAFIFIILLIFTGIGRVFVGVHYPLDILGGILIGALSIIITIHFRKPLLGSLS